MQRIGHPRKGADQLGGMSLFLPARSLPIYLVRPRTVLQHVLPPQLRCSFKDIELLRKRSHEAVAEATRCFTTPLRLRPSAGEAPLRTIPDAELRLIANSGLAARVRCRTCKAYVL
jgi:hypothetical protein